MKHIKQRQESNADKWLNNWLATNDKTLRASHKIKQNLIRFYFFKGHQQ